MSNLFIDNVGDHKGRWVAAARRRGMNLASWVLDTLNAQSAIDTSNSKLPRAETAATAVEPQPRPLQYYLDLPKRCELQITLTEEQAAAVLKAYDRGIEGLDHQERALLGQAIARMKDEIWR